MEPLIPASKPIYLDYMATTPVDPHVAQAMAHCLTMEGCFGNPASTQHAYGLEAEQYVERARNQVAQLVQADPKEIVFTSGATESNNLAIQGAAQFYQRQGKHIITLATEHKAVLDTFSYLQNLGFEVTVLPPKANGQLDLTVLERSIRDDTILASFMQVNNETGVIQDIHAIADCLTARGVLLHVDAAQSAGKIPIDLSAGNIALMSFSAHKLYGPKGIGALYVRRRPRIRLQAQIHGGGHQFGLRSGTLPTQQIVGMGEAFALAEQQLDANFTHAKACRDIMWQALATLPGIHCHSDFSCSIPHCLNVAVDGVDGEALVLSLNKLALSTGAACTSADPKPSHVLNAMGISADEASRTLRLSFGRFLTLEQASAAASHLVEQITKLRALSPIWSR